jgi:iron complex outermembrane receptor protein
MPFGPLPALRAEPPRSPWRSLALTFNVTYLATRYDDYAAPAYGTVPAYTYTGKQFLFQPKWQYSLRHRIVPPGRRRTQAGAWEFPDLVLLQPAQYPGLPDCRAWLCQCLHQLCHGGRALDLHAHGPQPDQSFFFTSLTPVGAAIKAGPYAGTLLLRAQNPRTVFLKAA